MNPSEAALVLGVAAAFDRRTVGEADALAWSAALPDVTADEARQAVVDHYRDSSDWVMPSHVRRLALAARRAARAAVPHVDPPPALADDPRTEQAWLRAYAKAFQDKGDLAAAIRAASAQVRVPIELEAGDA